MKMLVLALCLVGVLATVAFLVSPNVGSQFIGNMPSPGAIRGSVFKGLPRGLQ
jgi:hypothetical protein